MDILYAQEKLGTAVYDLATGTGTIHQRLWQAYLRFHPLSVDYFPEELKSEWLELEEILESREPTVNKKGDVIKGSVENSIENMPAEACSDVAKRIYNLNFKLNRFE